MAVVRSRGNGRMVDLGDEIAADKTNIFGEACRIDLGDQHTFHILESGAARAICSEVFDTQPELNWRWSIVAIAAVRGVIRKNLCAIRDRQAGFVLFLVADIGDMDAIANRSGGDRVHKVASIVNRLAIYAGDDIT